MSAMENPVAPPAAADAPAAVPLLSDGVSWPPDTKSYLEDFILTVLPTTPAFQILAQKMAWPVGFPRLVPEDLSANAGEYVWTDPVTGLGYLYLNGPSGGVSQTTYADLFREWGHKWGADPGGGNFLLPDTRSRALILSGTHADCDLGDTFGPATESSRRGTKHGHAITSLSVTGAPSITDPGHAHSIDNALQGGAGSAPNETGGPANPVRITTTGSNTTGITAGLGTLDVGGTIGTDTNEGGSGIVIGSLVVRF